MVGLVGVATSHMTMINFKRRLTQRARWTRVSSNTGSTDS
jgi:uncharacterized membrane protein